MNNTKQLAETIYQLSKKNGGCTVHPDFTRELPKAGYVVSAAASHKLVCDFTDPADIVVKIIEQWLACTPLKADEWYGAWVDNGVLMLEVSEWHGNAWRVMEVAAERNQHYVYAIHANKCYPVGGY